MNIIKITSVLMFLLISINVHASEIICSNKAHSNEQAIEDLNKTLAKKTDITIAGLFIYTSSNDGWHYACVGTNKKP